MEKILARVFPSRKSVAPAAATMADPVLLEAVFDYAQTDNEDLSSWEIVNASSSSLSSFDVESYSFDSSSFDDEHVPALNPSPSLRDLSDHNRHSIESIDGKFASIDDPGQCGDCEDCGDGNYDCEDVVEDEEEEDCDDDDGYDDYDDELVPRGFSDRFGKQRLMKLGKRACNPKMSNPKKLPCYFYNRPGGVHAAARDGVAWKRKVGRKNEA